MRLGTESVIFYGKMLELYQEFEKYLRIELFFRIATNQVFVSLLRRSYTSRIAVVTFELELVLFIK